MTTEASLVANIHSTFLIVCPNIGSGIVHGHLLRLPAPSHADRSVPGQPQIVSGTIVSFYDNPTPNGFAVRKKTAPRLTEHEAGVKDGDDLTACDHEFNPPTPFFP
jgi:hypothetical protein